MSTETRCGTGLLKEAAEWRLLSLLFECPSERWRKEVAALSREVESAPLRAAAAAALAEASEGLYHSVFGPGGPTSPREVSYHQSIELGALMAEISEYYRAFAYCPATAEPDDHITVQVGFVAYLRLKEAFALSCFDAESAAVTADAAQRFVRDHLSPAAEPIAGSLGSSEIEYLAAASSILHERVSGITASSKSCFGNCTTI